MATASAAGDFVAGIFTGLNVFIDCTGLSALLFVGPVLEPSLDIAVKHYLIGFIVTQAFVTMRSRCEQPMITPPGYEVMPGLCQLAAYLVAEVQSEVHTTCQLISTVIVGASLVSVLAGLVLTAMSWHPAAARLPEMIPEPVKAGVLAVIGWNLWNMSIELVTSLTLPELLQNEALLTTRSGVALWLPGQAAGAVLWLLLRSSEHPMIVPLTLVLVFALVHAMRVGSGMSVEEAQSAHWLLPSTEGRPFWTLWASLDVRAVRWDLLLRGPGLSHVVSAALVGPILNTCLNLALAQSTTQLDVPTEMRAHGTAVVAAGCVAGASNYLALSNTAVHEKCGGLTRASSWVAVVCAMVFLVVHETFAVIGFVPRAVIATVCAYAGFDFLWDSLVSGCAPTAHYATACLTLLLCNRYGMLQGGALAMLVHVLLRAAFGPGKHTKRD